MFVTCTFLLFLGWQQKKKEMARTKKEDFWNGENHGMYILQESLGQDESISKLMKI